MKGKTSMEAKESSKSSSNRDDGEGSGMVWNLPFSHRLTCIDLRYASEAALRCGCVCSALLFAELADEPRRAQADATASRLSVAQSVLPHPLSLRTTRTQTLTDPRRGRGSLSGVGSSVDPLAMPRHHHLHCLPLLSKHLLKDDISVSSESFMSIYKSAHIPDAICGVSLNTSLSLQAVAYAHAGDWMEALATYEIILQTTGGEGEMGGYSIDYVQSRSRSTQMRSGS